MKALAGAILLAIIIVVGANLMKGANDMMASISNHQQQQIIMIKQ